jgi:hypothetical protein
LAAVAGVLGDSGLSFDTRFNSRDLLYTLPFAVGAAAGSIRAPRTSATGLFVAACGIFAIESWTASVD